MRYVKWTVWLLLALLVFGFFHYTLPQHDIVRIVKTENRMIEIGENSIFWSRADVGMTNSAMRDVPFIHAVFPDGSPIEYRNEDTGWGWPPYFKIDSGRLTTQAADLVSTAGSPTWVMVTHYGWRNGLFSIYPNAVAVKQVEGPEVTIIPWVNIVILGVLAFILLMIRKMWLQFRERMVDPALADAGEAWDSVEARADNARKEARGFFGRIGAWLNTWKAKK